MININGQLFQRNQSVGHIDNRGLNYGDAVFETMRVLDGRIVFWNDHYARLTKSLKLLRMKMPHGFTKSFLQGEILKTLKNQGDKPQRVKLLVWRKSGGKYSPENCDIEYAISFEPLSNNDYVLNKNSYEIGLYTEFLMSSDVLSTLKTNNKIINVVGSIYAQENGFENCLLLNEKGNLVEALNGNIFLVYGNRIQTPAISQGCLDGVLRKQLIDVISTHPDFSVEALSITPDRVVEADEVLITNVVSGITSVSKYGEKKFGNATAKKLLALLNRRVAQTS